MDPNNVGGYVNANRLQVQMAYRCATVLRGVIEQYILRRLKTTVADQLPEKTEEVLFCRLTELQRQKYNDFLSSDEVDDAEFENVFGVTKNRYFSAEAIDEWAEQVELL